MKLRWYLTACLLLTSPASADSVTAIAQAEIDATVWRAFHHAFETLDGEGLNTLYAPEVLRATPEGIDTEGRFKAFNRTRFNANIERGDRIALDFWLDSRRTGEEISYEVGFYRVGITPRDGATDYFYGQFHIVLRKLDGAWKIVQDWDTDTIAGQPITAADFARSPAMW